MSKLAKIAICGSLGLVFGTVGLQSLGNAPKDAPPRLASTAPSAETVVDAEEPSEGVMAAVIEPISTPKTTAVSDKEVEQIDDMIAATINLSGNLCARPIEVRDTGDGLYGVRCITNRNGTGISDYIINSRTSEVIPI
ncbi:MAG: hypothetical protein AAF559_12155 [Pseudomonadota bacterium]